MTVRARPLAGNPFAVGVAPVTLYTVPAGRTLLFKGYVAVNHGAAPSRLYFARNGNGNAQRFHTTVITQSGDGASFTPAYALAILDEGDTLQCIGTGAGWTVEAFGALLDGNPS